MDEKIIYFLLFIAYGIYSSYSKSKKDAEKKKALEARKLNPNGNTKQQTIIEAPTQPAPNSWEELIRTITKEVEVKKQEVKKPAMKTQTASQKSQAAYNKKKKSVQEKVFVPMNVEEMNINERSADELSVDVMKGIPDEGISTTTKAPENLYEIKPYDFKEEENSYQLNAREALIQSVILTRPNY